jgi:hypothetical protein
MKTISMKGLADYMTASAVRQRKILREYKYPADAEAQAKILYYKEARETIAKFHLRTSRARPRKTAIGVNVWAVTR